MLWLISAAVASPSTTWASPNKIINPQPLCSQRNKHPPCFLWPTTYPHNPTTPRKKHDSGYGWHLFPSLALDIAFLLGHFLDHESPHKDPGWNIPPQKIFETTTRRTSFTVRVFIPLSRGENQVGVKSPKKYLKTKVLCVFFVGNLFSEFRQLHQSFALLAFLTPFGFLKPFLHVPLENTPTEWYFFLRWNLKFWSWRGKRGCEHFMQFILKRFSLGCCQSTHIGTSSKQPHGS